MEKVIKQLEQFLPSRRIASVLRDLMNGEIIKIEKQTIAMVSETLIYAKGYTICKVLPKWKGLSMKFSPQYLEEMKKRIIQDFQPLPEISVTEKEIWEMFDKVNPTIRLLRWKGVEGTADIIDCCVTFSSYLECLKWLEERR